MSKPAARIGDMHVCPMVTPGTPPVPHVGGPVTGPGVPTVLICGQPAAVMGDMCTCVGPPDTIVLGSVGVLIGGKPAARMGDMCAHGGTIAAGAPTVLIGELSPGAPVPPVLLGPIMFKLQSAINKVVGADSPSGALAMKMAQATMALQQAALTGQAMANPAAFAPTPKTPCEQLASMAGMNMKDRMAAMKDLEENLHSNQPDVADQLSKDHGVLEKAYLSEAIYPNSKLKPEDIGFAVVSDEDRRRLGLLPASKYTDQQLYAKGDPPKYVLCMRGTFEKKDWGTNAKQALGFEDTSYNEAIINSQELGRRGVNVELTGHSKGGGMAAAASAASGLPATTFNAAGVHQKTLISQGLTEHQIAEAARDVEAYHNARDPLNFSQDNRKAALGLLGGLAGSVGGPVGTAVSMALGFVLHSGGVPQAFGQRTTVPAHRGQGLNPLTNHGMEAMMKSLAEQQDNRLNDQLGCNSPTTPLT